MNRYGWYNDSSKLPTCYYIEPGVYERDRDPAAAATLLSIDIQLTLHKHPFLFCCCCYANMVCFGSNSTRYSGGRITTTTFSSVEKRERRCWESVVVVLGSMGW